MALCRSFALGRLAQNQLFKNYSYLQITARPVAIIARKAVQPIDEDYDIHNMRIGRPQSPHLTIYAPQLTSLLSITHRFTGMALSAYVMGLGLGAVVLPNDISHYMSMLEGVNPIILISAKFILAYPLCYHLANGIRHLFWDSGKFLTNKGVDNTGYIMLTVSAAFATALSLM